MGLDFFVNKEKQNVEKESEPSEYQEEEDQEDPMMDPEFSNGGRQFNVRSEMSYEDMQQKKAYLLSKLKRMEKRGLLASRRFGVEHDLEEIEAEVLRIEKERDIEIGIKYCKQGLVFFASTIEMANNNFKMGAKLDGWSSHMFSTQDDYDEVFEELYEKYATNIKAGPEIRLITMLAGSAFMFHLQKALSEKTTNDEDLLSKLGNLGGTMKGPSKSTEEILRNLGEDDSDVSDVSSIVSEQIELEKTIAVPVKKGGKPRGRPKKNM
jgi:hypothetical protein